MSKPLQVCTFTGGFWLRVFGVGFSIKRLDLYPPLFSQRGKSWCAFGCKFNVLPPIKRHITPATQRENADASEVRT